MPDPTPSTPRDDFTQSFDARVWARAFLDTVREHPEVPTDEQTMLGWFANALMRGYDEHTWKMQRDSAALAALAGPLAAEELQECRTRIKEWTFAHTPSLSAEDVVWEHIDKVLTAYTALAAECARLTSDRDGLKERIAAVGMGLSDGAPAELLARFTASEFDWSQEQCLDAARSLLTRLYPEVTEAVERHREKLTKLEADLAALRATVAEACALLKEHGGHSSSAVKDFLARTPTPEGQG